MNAKNVVLVYVNIIKTTAKKCKIKRLENIDDNNQSKKHKLMNIKICHKFLFLR